MHHSSRAACKAERERTLVDAAAVEAECALADNMVQVITFWQDGKFKIIALQGRC